jgi:glycosyltransferase involved in cell wall biosynthesis
LSEAQNEEVRNVYYAFHLARQARRLGLHHLHAHFASTATTVTRMAARFAGLSFSFTAHAKDIFHEEVREDDLRRKLTDASAVVTVSDFNRDHLLQTYGPAAARVRRIYNGLDLTQFPYREPSDRPPIIVAVGRLVEKKGFADLVAACALLATRRRLFTCQIIGGGDLTPSLQAQVERLGLGDQVQLLGPLPQSEVIRHVQRASVMAAPCVVGRDGNRDGLPTVLLEAMALGTPCVSTDVTGIPEVVRPDETGLLVSQRDPQGLADALERLLADAALRGALAARARRLIEAEFDICQNAAQLRSVFFECAQARMAPPTGTLREVG